MRLSILTVGRLGRSVEAELARDYAARATASGRALALGPCEIIEVEAKKPGKAAEAEVILAAVGEGARIIACDEHGKAWPSRDFATRIAAWRDGGERRAVFIIGGADGLDRSVLDAAHETLAFGVQTWPHALARAMLAEQLYRATTILGGSPYHRD